MINTGTLKTIDVNSFDFKNIEYNSLPSFALTMNLGDLIMKNQTDETFVDLMKRNPSQSGILYYFTRIRLMLHDYGMLEINNTFDGVIDKSYRKRLEILLNKAGFIDYTTSQTSEFHRVKAVKRPAVVQDIGYGLTLREVLLPEEIYQCHLYAKDFYYYKDFNYDLDVVKQFDLNCDHFAVYDENNKICSLARIIIRVPGYCCPFMHATLAGVSENKHFILSGKDQRIGEVMAIYSSGKKGVVAFKRLMEYLTQYGSNIAFFDSVWTTYDDSDNYTGNYYRNKFLMEDTGIKLKYSDFGGEWNLIVTNRLEELKNLHHHIFRQGKE